MTEDAKHLAPDDLTRQIMNIKLAELRKDVEEMVFISFPGDEKSSDGCILFEKRAQVEELIK